MRQRIMVSFVLISAVVLLLLGLVALQIVYRYQSLRMTPFVLPTYTPGSVKLICSTFQRLTETQFCLDSSLHDANTLERELDIAYVDQVTHYDDLIPLLDHLESRHSFCVERRPNYYQTYSKMNCPPPEACSTDNEQYQCSFGLTTESSDMAIIISINRQTGVLSNFGVIRPSPS